MTLVAQSYIWDYNEEKTNEGSGWGRWVRSTDDIKITTYQGGIYGIAIYGAYESHPTMTIYVKYKKRDGEYYRYLPTSHNEKDIQENVTYVNCTCKLSCLAKGWCSGCYNKAIYFYMSTGLGVAYRLGKI